MSPPSVATTIAVPTFMLALWSTNHCALVANPTMYHFPAIYEAQCNYLKVIYTVNVRLSESSLPFPGWNLLRRWLLHRRPAHTAELPASSAACSSWCPVGVASETENEKEVGPQTTGWGSFILFQSCCLRLPPPLISHPLLTSKKKKNTGPGPRHANGHCCTTSMKREGGGTRDKKVKWRQHNGFFEHSLLHHKCSGMPGLSKQRFGKSADCLTVWCTWRKD